MGLPAVPGLIIREFFNTLTGKSQLGLSSWSLIALLLALALGQIVVLFAGRFTKTQHRFTMSSLLRRNLLESLLSRPVAHMSASGSDSQTASPGEVISYFRDDAQQVEHNVAFVSENLGAGLFAIGSLVILLRINVQMTLFVFLPLVVMVAIVQLAQSRIKKYRRASRQATEQVTGIVGEIFSSVLAIKVAGAEKDL